MADMADMVDVVNMVDVDNVDNVDNVDVRPGRSSDETAAQPCGRNTARTQPSFFVLNSS
jgi:hypothetical protein